MSKTNFEMVREFHEVYDCTRNSTPTILDHDTVQLREKLMSEELRETVEAMYDQDLKSVAKELADILYVVYGTAVSYGIDIDKVFKEVHSSNMSKLGPNGEVLRREDGKVLKGPNYREPDLSWVSV